MEMSGMWGTTEPNMFDPYRPQKALAASVVRIVGDPRIAAEVVMAVGHHLLVTASEQMLSQQYAGYARGLMRVAEGLHREVPVREEPVVAGIVSGVPGAVSMWDLVGQALDRQSGASGGA